MRCIAVCLAAHRKCHKEFIVYGANMIYPAKSHTALGMRNSDQDRTFGIKTAMRFFKKIPDAQKVFYDMGCVDTREVVVGEWPLPFSVKQDYVFIV